ncbi:hypothetical protein [Oceanibacterium hippocampi]|uniref:Uncharacterized protein n=1 Tax=Oceanibacterium hippocampi TaxID=745714 RepID=A0A1Y5SPV3_9PROT|nr:hypothetical protein [Oceanibacterium hippocampi]SLN45246.1 hypothetical protein OCH7691_01938 [Oceanibacterium hippocampi]
MTDRSGSDDSAMAAGQLRRVIELLDAYGADPARWPAAERGLARLLESGQPTVEAHRAAAARLDRRLDEAAFFAPGPAPSAALYGAVLARAPGARFGTRLAALWPFGPIWRPAAGLLMAALLGLTIGVASPPASDEGVVYVTAAADLETLAYGGLASWEDN